MSKLKFDCKGGPFDGAKIWLEKGSTGTLVFSLNGQRGSYERDIDRSNLKRIPDLTNREVIWKEEQNDVREKEG